MSLPESMKVIEITEPGGPEVLQPAERPVPEPKPGEVLIKVSAAGVNRPDVIQRMGHYPPPPGQTDLPGLEVSGTVVGKGEGVPEFAMGQTVCALTPGGGYAEFCVAPSGACLPVPHGLDMVQAAAIVETSFTVWHNVFQRGQLKPGETFLVHGGSSGIGTMAIQMAKSFGATVIATAGSAEKCDTCRELGADLAIDYKEQDWSDEVRRFTEKRGVDVILDMVGGDYIQKDIDALAWDGRLVFIAFLKGAKAEVNLQRFMVKRQTMTGSTLRAQSDAIKAGIAREVQAQIWPKVEDGTIKPVIYKTFPLDQAADAHALMETNAHIGKIILTVA